MDSHYALLMAELEKFFGKASSAGFGSAVFQELSGVSASGDSIALKHYKAFLGPKWNAERQAAWMSGWKQVYSRPGGAKGDILSELASIADAEAKRSVPLLTELIEHASAGRDALAAAFNHPDVKELSIHHVGDGDAMSGMMITAIFREGFACSVIALMD